MRVMIGIYLINNCGKFKLSELATIPYYRIVATFTRARTAVETRR